MDIHKRVEAHDCPMSTCAAPAGSPCRTTKGRVAIQYHTARFRLVPSLAKALNVAVPAVRKPGTPWVQLPRPAGAGAEPVSGSGVLVRTLSPILLAYSVPGGAGGSLVGTAAAVLAFPVAGGVWNVDAAEVVAEGA
ncbi:zinc finger domain-containing protein [Streptomyces violaceusniger]|uniref:DNA-binding phage zinc finger domain-containing protein n=1 Tax=Streptomyces violaceusniger TaxID=68280 RepID=A0A4D4LHM8_STRVO|nr:hypothetical protein SVIO_110780 [Streptomyces violaceusniger]